MGKAKWVVAVVVAAAALGGAGVACVLLYGPSGATTTLGGTIPAKELPELPGEASRWVNGAPVTPAAAKDQVLLVEGWHPA